MRQETKDKLDRLVARDRRTLWVTALGVVAVLAGLAAIGTQQPKSRTQMQAIVRAAHVEVDDAGQRHLVLEVELENRQRVRVASLSLQPPEVGKPITLMETVGWLGYHNYQWDGQAK